MRFLKRLLGEYWPYGRATTEHIIFALSELVLMAFLWRHYFWGSGYRVIFLALNVFAVLIAAYLNGAIVSWLNRPQKKKPVKHPAPSTSVKPKSRNR